MILVTIALAAALAAAPRPEGAADSSAVAAAKRALQAAVDRTDASAVLAARASFSALLASDPRSAALHYWLGYADWRAVTFLMGRDRVRARRLADDGLAAAAEALDLSPGSGEALALQAGLQGLSIGLAPEQMMTLGPAAEAGLTRARALAPGSPRVWLFDGIQTLNKPAAFGGGPAAALEKLRCAQALCAGDSASGPLGPDWGRDDVHAWAGRASLAAGDTVAAVAAWRAALAVNPRNRWVARVLLPQAGQPADTTTSP